MQRLVRRRGGIPTAGAEVTRSTTVLVRGDSSVWAFGDYGTKESDAARFIRQGASIPLVHDSEFRKLVEQGHRARVADRVAGQPVQWGCTSDEATIRARREGRRTARSRALGLGRLEQSYLRSRLFGAAEEAACSLCGRRLPVALLVAAHLKPRSDCARRERLDAENIVASMCLLGCDALYERGIVAVSEGGRIRVSTAHSSPAVKAVLRQFRGLTCNAWNTTTAGYFEWHLRGRFQGSHATS